MKISKNGLNQIKKFEGFSAKTYDDGVGVLTIGYGTTSSVKDITGVTVKKGMTCTKEQAEKWLEDTINKKFAVYVSKYDYDFNQNEFDALCSFCYNLGTIDGLTAHGTRSKKEIASRILAYNKAGGKFNFGLNQRRKAEQKLFLTPVKKEVPKCPYVEPIKNVTSVTQAKLRSCKSYISQGISVRWVQWYLDKLGYNLGKSGIDGCCGSLTVNALLDFQMSHKLVEDGICGAKTRQALVKAFNKKYNI